MHGELYGKAGNELVKIIKANLGSAKVFPMVNIANAGNHWVDVYAIS